MCINNKRVIFRNHLENPQPTTHTRKHTQRETTKTQGKPVFLQVLHCGDFTASKHATKNQE
jgi:hypothetical protein